jgi:hypothetical protein
MDLPGKRQLHKDAVDIRVNVKGVDVGKELFLRSVVGKLHFYGADSHARASLDLFVHIDARRGVLSNKDNGKARRPSGKRGGLVLHFEKHFFSNFFSIE